MKTQAVLFDLDDTLIDFQHSRRCGLRAVQERLPGLARVPIEELELVHEDHLQASYARTLTGRLSDEDARLERMRGICHHYQLAPDAGTLARAATAYAQEQQTNTRLIPGVPALLDALRGRVKVGLVTNGPSARQRGKIERLGTRAADFHVVAISEEVGAMKPDPAIFRYALAELGLAPDRVTMVGDSWEKDILGALECGMDAVWLNRYRVTCPEPGLVAEIRSLAPVADMLATLCVEARRA